LYSGTPVLVSACLIGIACRYDGGHKTNSAVLDFLKGRLTVPICPEQLGGLATPRPSASIVEGDGFAVLNGTSRVINDQGRDVTAEFLRGARHAETIARVTNARECLLKERSPSCGVKKIVRGGQVFPGPGVAAALLLKLGCFLTSDEDIGR